jgi:hypothetical protein
METDQVAEYVQRIAEATTESSKVAWRNGLADHKVRIREAKEAHQENTDFYLRRFLKSTHSTVVGLDYILHDPQDGNSLGYYVAQFKYRGHRTDTDVEEHIIVPDEWVARVFKPGMADYVRSMCKDIDRDPENFVSVPEKGVYLDQRTVIKVKYYPPRTANDKMVLSLRDAIDGDIMHDESVKLYKRKFSQKLVPERWEAMFHDESTEPVTRNYVEEQFGKPYCAMVQGLMSGGGPRKKARFVPVPPGRRVVRTWGPAPRMMEHPLQCKYVQGETDTCVFTSFASAMFHGGLENGAHEIFTAGMTTYLQDPTPLKSLCRYVRQMGLKFCQAKLPKEETTVEAISVKSNWQDLFILLLGGTDGRRDHCVTVHNNLIFDANESTTMPLCKENMDYCCSDATGEPVLKKIVVAYRFTSKLLVGNTKTCM